MVVCCFSDRPIMAQSTSPAKWKCRWSERVADGLKGPGNLDTTATTSNLQQAQTSTVKQQRIPAQSSHHVRFFFGAFSLCRSRYLNTDHRSRPGTTAPRSTVFPPCWQSTGFQGQLSFRGTQSGTQGQQRCYTTSNPSPRPCLDVDFLFFDLMNWPSSGVSPP